MIKRKKILIFISGLIALLIILLAALQLLAPRIMNLESTKVKIRQVVLEKTGGELNYDRIGISIFPRPGIELERVSYSLPGTLKGTVDSAELNARLLPLFRGKVVISSLLIYEPSFTIDIPEKEKKRKETREQRKFADLVKERLLPVLAALDIAGQDIEMSIYNGTVDLVGNAAPLLSFKEVDAFITSSTDMINAEVECRSNVSDRIVALLTLDPEEPKLLGEIDLKKAELKQIFDRTYKPASRFVKDTELDLSFGFKADERTIQVKDISGDTGRSVFTGLNAVLDLSQEEPYIKATSGTVNVDLTELREVMFEAASVKNALKGLRSIEGTVELDITGLEGKLMTPEKWEYRAKGAIRNVTVEYSDLPEQVSLPSGTFESTHKNISFENVTARMLDTDVTVSGLISNYLRGKVMVGLDINGIAGAGTGRWVQDIATIPPEFKTDQPLTIDKARFGWKGGRVFSLNGQFSISDGLSLDVDAGYDPTGIDIKKFELKDSESNAFIALNATQKELDLKFSGNITNSTLSKLMVMDRGVKGWVKVVFDTKITLDHPGRFTADGHLEGEHIIIPVKGNEELELKKISIKAVKDTVTLLSSEIVLSRRVLTVRGDVKGSKDGFIVNADVSSEGISWEDIERLLAKDDNDNEIDEQGSSGRIPIKGTVRAHSDFFSYDTYRWEPVDATITLDRDRIDIAVNNAVICNISTPGTITVSGGEIGIDLMVASKNSPIGDSLACFTGREEKVTGTFDIKGKVAGRAAVDQLIRSLKGDVNLSVRDGVIYEQTFFTKVFAVINVTEVFRGNYGDIDTEGFAYSSIKAKAVLHDGKVKLDEIMMDGSTMDMVGKGEIDSIKKTIDATFIVAPLKTVNAVVRIIPILRNITGGTLITVALTVTGKIGDPRVQVVPPSTVGEGLVGMMKRTFQLPFKILGLDDIDQKNSEEKEQSK